MTVTFTDTSSGTITSRRWDFNGDGITDSTKKDPVFTCRKPGIYTERLTVTGPNSSDSMTRTGNIHVSALLPLPGFTDLPTDPDNDGLYEDLNGNGRKDFNDVYLFYKNMDWIAANEPLAAFDFNGNVRIDFNDIYLVYKEMI